MKGPKPLVERKQTNTLACIDITVLGKCGQVRLFLHLRESQKVGGYLISIFIDETC